MIIDLQHIDDQNLIDSFPRIATNYPKSKEEVWADISQQMEKIPNQQKQKVIRLNFRFAIAATLLLLISLAGFMRFYTKTIECPAGEHIALLLPDGTKTELNASSKISFHPLWWRFSRNVKFEGEAFFEVENGSRFSVVSPNGTTSVLGTSFNIFSRNNEYKVTCFTGKVSVSAKKSNELIILLPTQQAELTKNGKMDYVQQADTNTAKSWIDNMFVFTSEPLTLVISEIERQYNIKINLSETFNFTYTGYFTKQFSAQDVLDLVCTPLGLKFEQKPNGEYLVYQN